MVFTTQIAVESQVSGSIARARNNVLFYLVVTAKTIAPLRRGIPAGFLCATTTLVFPNWRKPLWTSTTAISD